MRLLLLLILAATLTSSCRFIQGKKVRGNGNLVTRDRTISDFEGIESFGSFDIKLIQSETSSVKIETDENIQEYIETYVENGNLHIKTRDRYNLRPRHDIKITVTAPEFNTIETNGSGNIYSDGIINTDSSEEVRLRVAGSGNIDVEMKTGKIDSEIAGSGNIKVKGSAKEFDGGIYGSGNIRAGGLQTSDAKVEIAGSGNAEVYAISNLDVNIMGSGEVKHRGSAQISTKITGSGSVVKID